MTSHRHVPFEVLSSARPFILISALTMLLALALSGCAKDPVQQLADSAVRQKVIEALVTTPTTRQEVVERLVGAPAERAVVVERILKDPNAAGDLVQTILADDRGKALVVSKVTADDAGAKTFIRMLMLTGVMGVSLTQQQADMLGMGDAYARGNRKRTMSDLKRLGKVIDDSTRGQAGSAPDCQDLADIRSCLVNKLPPDSVASLRLSDAWGRPFYYRSYRDGSGYALLSYATDGYYDGLGNVGPTEGLDCDIVFSNGSFVQWPGMLRREEIP